MQAKPFNIFAILFTVVALAATIVLNYASSASIGQDWGLFESSPGNISDLYHTRVTPAGYTFIIWAVIYISQVLWVLYALTLLCRKSAQGYLYYSPDFMPLALYLVYWLNLACNIIWLFIFDREYQIIALVFIALIAVSLIICVGISVYSLNKHKKALIQQSRKSELWWVRLLVQQALALYGSWVFIATHVSLAIVLIYEVGLSDENASRIAVGILAFFVLLYFLLDIFVLDKYTRYLIAPYLVLIWALVGIMVENWDNGEISSIMIIVLLAVGGLTALTKLTTTIYRACTSPDPLINEVQGQPKNTM